MAAGTEVASTHVRVFGTHFADPIAKPEIYSQRVQYSLVTSSICDTMSSHLPPMGILEFWAIRDAMAKATTNRTTLQDTTLYNPWVLHRL